jgi:hypothetical protein
VQDQVQPPVLETEKEKKKKQIWLIFFGGWVGNWLLS